MPVASVPSIHILSGASALNAVGLVPDGRVIGGLIETALYVVFGSGTSAGQVTIEGAHSYDYAGTWAPIATVSWVSAARVHLVAITGRHLALRARISTAIAGGTVDVWVIGS